jgi:hypothetical protein
MFLSPKLGVKLKRNLTVDLRLATIRTQIKPTKKIIRKSLSNATSQMAGAPSLWLGRSGAKERLKNSSVLELQIVTTRGDGCTGARDSSSP